jgi:hypothetical protein
LQDPPKFTQIGILGLKIMPSGNPAAQLGFVVADDEAIEKWIFSSS